MPSNEWKSKANIGWRYLQNIHLSKDVFMSSYKSVEKANNSIENGQNIWMNNSQNKIQIPNKHKISCLILFIIKKMKN